ncbi:Bax inhibitor-1/YccA family protein [Denitrificimonas caeni]|uniref:Bax inhibitor-1/YccA family protein n=1 Tax=Denitrificimonas caeni TaxID=521720 RepID=UPI0019640371|nr:Bax inhibitor-1/YccA family protein [Denitrificimonas caeni]
MREQQNYSLEQGTAVRSESSAVLRNTYALLAMTLAFSGLVAYISQQMNMPHPGMMLTLVGFYGLFFLTMKLRNSGWGLLSTFALTGFMGYTLGPILNMYMSLPNGASVISSAFAMTAFVFTGLSAYVLITRKDMSFLNGFITVGFFVLLAAIIASFIFDISGLQLAISAGFVLFSSAMILFQTSAIIQGGERNYIMATISLYISIYNLFLSLLQILGVTSRD